MLKQKDRIALTACSNALRTADKPRLGELLQVLRNMGLDPVLSPDLFADSPFGAYPQERADTLCRFFADPEIKAIFDLSGGNLANEIIDRLDYDTIRRNPKPFCGYSDLTCVINAIYRRTGVPGYLWQVRNLVRSRAEEQQENFRSSVMYGRPHLYDVKWKFLQGHEMEGTVIGGNIRCFLKLAGTRYLPEFDGRLLFLESLGGDGPAISAALHQLRQMHAFERINGLLLGTFTELNRNLTGPKSEDLVLRATEGIEVPVAVTNDIGHGDDSKCIVIGADLRITDEERIRR